MELQPFGPIEEAIEKSITDKTVSPKIKYRFWWGVIAILVAGGSIYWLISEINKKNKNNVQKEIT